MKNKRLILQRTFYLGIILASAFTTSGCATFATSKATSLSDPMIQSHKGDVQGLYDEWIKPQTIYKLVDGENTAVIDVQNPNVQMATEKSIAKDFERFCASNDGTVEIFPYKFGQKSVCTIAGGGYLGEIETKRYDVGLAIKVDSREDRARSRQAAITAAAAQRQRDYESLSSDSLSLEDLNRLIPRFENDDPKNLIPHAKALQARLDDERREANEERRMQLEAAAAAKRRALENKHIGDRICINGETTASFPTQWVVMGKRHYESVTGTDKVAGYVEKIEGMRIQIRISSITFYNYPSPPVQLDSLSDFNGDTIQNGSIIWDDIHSWDACD